MKTVTSDEVKAAAMASGKDWFPVRECSICRQSIGYRTLGDWVGFDGNCSCSSSDYSGLQERTWRDVADLVNLQTVLQWRNKYRALFGLTEDAA